MDNEYYASLPETERLELLMDLRSMIGSDTERIEPVVVKRHIQDEEEV